MSAIKRDRGVKDWGRMIEGHGGMLDRLEAVGFREPIMQELAGIVGELEQLAAATSEPAPRLAR